MFADDQEPVQYKERLYRYRDYHYKVQWNCDLTHFHWNDFIGNYVANWPPFCELFVKITAHMVRQWNEDWMQLWMKWYCRTSLWKSQGYDKYTKYYCSYYLLCISTIFGVGLEGLLHLYETRMFLLESGRVLVYGPLIINLVSWFQFCLVNWFHICLLDFKPYTNNSF